MSVMHVGWFSSELAFCPSSGISHATPGDHGVLFYASIYRRAGEERKGVAPRFNMLFSSFLIVHRLCDYALLISSSCFFDALEPL